MLLIFGRETTVMLIRRNTKAFKTIHEIVIACKDRPDRENLVRLYITKAGHSIDDRIQIEGIEGGAELFYDMTYQAVLNNLKSSEHQLQHSDHEPGIYFFHRSSNKVWDETPFEFDEAVKGAFSSLSDLPNLRKKQKTEIFAFPAPKKKAEPQPEKQRRPSNPKSAPRTEGPKQPDLKLKHAIHFTDLEKIVFRQPRLTRRDVFDYYYRVADILIPWLKDRPLTLRFRRPDGRNIDCSTLDDMKRNNLDVPEWLESDREAKTKRDLLRCDDREHLLFYAETGCLEFTASASRMRSINAPDYLMIEIDSPDADAGKAIEVAGGAKIILDALKLHSFVKSNGISAIHIYIPLDSKSSTDTVVKAAEFLCKLIRVRMPDSVVIEGTDDNAYGKVNIGYRINESNRRVVVPYSLIAGESANVATPLHWEELDAATKFDNLDPGFVLKRLKRKDDPFGDFFRKKVSANLLLAKLTEHYAFLF